MSKEKELNVLKISSALTRLPLWSGEPYLNSGMKGTSLLKNEIHLPWLMIHILTNDFTGMASSLPHVTMS